MNYRDLAALPEDERIKIIVREAVENDQGVAVAIDNDPTKIARYQRKMIAAASPALLEITFMRHKTPGAIFLKVKPKT